MYLTYQHLNLVVLVISISIPKCFYTAVLFIWIHLFEKMEETHHSTNEELQATLQELADLQVQLNEFQAENDKIKEEKQTLKRKLDVRTEQFKQARDQVNISQNPKNNCGNS